MSHCMRRIVQAAVLLAAFVFAASGAARAQTWTDYPYPDAGFQVQFPVAPTLSNNVYRTATGVSAPARVYAARDGGIDYSVTVADFAASTLQAQAAIDDAVAMFGRTGDIKLDVSERIDRQFGRELRVLGRDGSLTATAIFFVDHRLYVLAGRTLTPNPDPASPLTVRFQQSLQFIDKDGRPPRRPEDGGGPGFGPGRGPPGERQAWGPGGEGGPRRPPPQAFADCRGKSLGDSVQHQIPNGSLVAATCVQTPDGLAARPERGRPGSSDGAPPG